MTNLLVMMGKNSVELPPEELGGVLAMLDLLFNSYTLIEKLTEAFFKDTHVELDETDTKYFLIAYGLLKNKGQIEFSQE